MRLQIRQCLNSTCRFRFPWNENDLPSLDCPRCGAAVQVISERVLPVEQAPIPSAPSPALPVVAALLDNVRSTFNVGSIFRCADGAGIAHLFLCGITPTPDHPKVAKTALGAEQTVPWSYHTNAVALACALQIQHHQLWVLEELPNAAALFVTQRSAAHSPIVLVLGNEVAGVDPGLVELADRIVTLPMHGAKRSLNVAIAFGIAAYTLRFNAHTSD